MKVPAKNLCGKRVMEYRKARGWSQTELAIQIESAGGKISRDAIAKIETGRRCVTDFEILQISQALVVKIEGLIPSAPT
jgi:transcriptional regulator with XRE-family HTH domain